MNFGRALIVFPLALIFCVALVMSERQRVEKHPPESPFVQLSTKKAPFKNETEKTVFHLSPQRELIIVGPDSEFEPSTKQLISGWLYWDNTYLSPTDYKNTKEKRESATTGQFQIDTITITPYGGGLYAYRDAQKKITTVYTDHSPGYLWLPGNRNAFFIPPHHSLRLRDKLITESLGKAFYTKQKKELRLTELSAEFESSESIELLRKTAQSQKEALNISLEKYAQKAIFGWSTIDPGSLVGRAKQSLSYVQRFFAVGYTQSMKSEYGFLQTVSPVGAFAYRSIDPQRQVSKNTIDRLQDYLISTEFIEFFINHPEKRKPWDDYLIALKIGSSSNEYDPMAPIWQQSQYYQIESFDLLEEALEDLNQSLLSGRKALIEEQLIKFRTKLEQISQEDQTHRLTNLRRFYTHLIQKFPDEMLEPANLTSLNQIVASEMSVFKKDPSLHNEKTLENAQFILALFDQLHNPKDPQENEDAKLSLKDIFKTLEVEEALERIGRELFTPKEISTIRAVSEYQKYLNDRDQVESIEAQNQLIQNLLRIDIKEEPVNNEPSEQDLLIDSKEELQSLLQKRNIDTSSANFFLAGGQIRFAQAFFNKKTLSGKFSINQQNFIEIKLEDTKQTNIGIEQLVGILIKIDRGLAVNEPEEDIDIGKALIFKATVAKIAENFGKFDLRISPKNISQKGSSLEVFRIEEATVKNRYKLSFEYDINDQKARQLVIQSGNNRFEFGAESFDIRNLAERTEELYREQFQP